MRRRHTTRRRAASAWLGAIALLAPAARAQEAVDLAPPGPAEAMAAYVRVNAWVRSWHAPDQPPPELPPVPGAAITLRLGGVALARVTTFDESGALLPAVRRAITEAETRMPYERDVFWDQRVAEAAKRVTISLELAGPLVPLTEETDVERELAIDPGLDGIAVRLGDRVEAMSPAQMLGLAITPSSALNIVRSRLSDEPELLLEPDRMRGLTYYRFRTTHLAQPEPGAEPIFLHRGGRVVSLAEITAPMLRTFADDMAAHLVGRDWPGVERLGMLGTYHPTTGQYDPPQAPAVSQALVAYALLRYASAPGVDPEGADAARTQATDLLEDLALVEADEETPWADPATAAACLLALAEVERAGLHQFEDALTLGPNCRETIARSFNAGGFDPAIPTGTYSVIAHALAVIATSDDQRALARRAVSETYLATPPAQLPAQMPWLGWAELALAGDGAIAADAALRDAREAVWDDQFTAADARFGDQDLVGGIVVIGGGLSPLPSWHTARRVAFPATMLGDPRLTGRDERSAQLVRLLRSIRFIRQLQVDDAVIFLCRSPSRAVGGIRSSLWDQRMPPDATAFALLAVTEALRSLDRLQGP